MARIYLASSWRNEYQPELVRILRATHEVYDFRNPYEGNHGFHWSDIGLPEDHTASEYIERLIKSPIASHGFTQDLRAMRWADTFVLLLPCGRSAHLEMGYATGAGKRTIVYLHKYDTPELMYLLCDRIVTNIAQLLLALDDKSF